MQNSLNIKNYKNLSELFYSFLKSGQTIHQHTAIGLKRTTLHMAYELKQMIMKPMFMLHRSYTDFWYDTASLFRIFLKIYQNISIKFAKEVKITSSLENKTEAQHDTVRVMKCSQSKMICQSMLRKCKQIELCNTISSDLHEAMISRYCSNCVSNQTLLT